ncbi:hypothetical protein Ddye_012989 [Dipteronia dyeriana]|uniref:Reverse transcriptase domain-containing protein n=1 Tax=Dipteronia dyeriana TaxID=168575 RepID=A0AAD9X5C1_9ROSI|nr:hypothetical protein Ddye_012989 [Dipteronia dyeriana]
MDTPNFKYHWRCDKLKLSHLSFADDLIMLCHGSYHSALELKSALDEFFLLSRLCVNHAKSNIFISGVPVVVSRQLINLFGYPVGSFPIRYLGIPIISSKLNLRDCFPLVDKVNVIVLDDNWRWLAAMSIDLAEIWSRMPSYNPNSTLDDRILWLTSSSGIYSAASAMESLRTPHP